MRANGPAVSCLGTSALLFEAPGETTLANQQRIWALSREAEAWPEVREAVPGVNNLLLTFVEPPRRVELTAVELLTRPGGMTYRDYVDRIIGEARIGFDPAIIARDVKELDALDNISRCLDTRDTMVKRLR